MKLTITNYNLKEIEKQVIVACLKNNPGMSMREQASLLNMSERSLYRLIRKYNLKNERVTIGQFKAIEQLIKKGYKIEAPKNA